MKFNELDGANALISEIEKMYPHWGKYRDLAEAIQVKNETKNAIIKNLRATIDRLMEKMYPRSRIAEADYFQFIGLIKYESGIVEQSIFAPNLSEAVRLIDEKIYGDGGELVSIKTYMPRDKSLKKLY